jgi:hypothetical protein
MQASPEENVWTLPLSFGGYWTVAPETRLPKALSRNCDMLCGYCIRLKNYRMEFTPEGLRVAQVLCKSCRAVVNRHDPKSRCRGGRHGCIGRCYVDELGNIAPLCTVCYQARKEERALERAAKKKAARK